jgi:hypothetical protein
MNKRNRNNNYTAAEALADADYRIKTLQEAIMKHQAQLAVYNEIRGRIIANSKVVENDR